MTELIKQHLNQLTKIEQATRIDILDLKESQVLINIQYPNGSNTLRTLTILG